MNESMMKKFTRNERDEKRGALERGIGLTFVGFSRLEGSVGSAVRAGGECEGGVHDDDDEDGDPGKGRRERGKRDEYNQTETDGRRLRFLLYF